MSSSNGKHRVVIVGSGFGGLAAAKSLRQAPVDVTVIDRTNHHLFQPLLYQMATGISLRAISPRRSGTSSAARRTPGCSSAMWSMSILKPAR